MTSKSTAERKVTHTPGPWRAELGEMRNQRGGFGIHVGRGIVICGRAGWPDRAEESEANARLIAAAPDLLAALKEVAHHADDECGFMVQVKAAIAKAEGVK